MSTKYEINEIGDSNTGKVEEYFQSYRSSGNSEASISGGALTSHVFNCNLVLWLCQDLLPFDMVVKKGMIAFFQKNVSANALPSPATLSSTVLSDIYLAAVPKVKNPFIGVKSMCVMFDGWTNKYHARPYMAELTVSCDNN